MEGRKKMLNTENIDAKTITKMFIAAEVRTTGRQAFHPFHCLNLDVICNKPLFVGTNIIIILEYSLVSVHGDFGLPLVAPTRNLIVRYQKLKTRGDKHNKLLVVGREDLASFS